MIPFKFLCDMKVFCSISDLPYTVVGSSVPRITCDEVFLKYHIWSLDHQCCGKDVAKFPGVPYMVVGSSVSRKECDEVFLECHIQSLDRQCRRKNVTKFS